MIQNIEKQVLLQTIDKSWREHLLKLEHLRSVIGFRGYAQRDPLNEYKSEAYDLFEVLLQTIGEEVTKFMAFFQLVDSSKLENENKKTSNSDLRYKDFEGNSKESPQNVTVSSSDSCEWRESFEDRKAELSMFSTSFSSARRAAELNDSRSSGNKSFSSTGSSSV